MQVTTGARGAPQARQGAGGAGEGRAEGQELSVSRLAVFTKVIVGSADVTSASPVTPGLCPGRALLPWGGLGCPVAGLGRPSPPVAAAGVNVWTVGDRSRRTLTTLGTAWALPRPGPWLACCL